MSDLTRDAMLNSRLTHDRPGRRFVGNEDARWGELILPAPGEGPAKDERGLRLLLFASWGFGCRAAKIVTEFERRYPDRLSLVGLVTDDPINADAKVSAKKRIWKFLDSDWQLKVEAATVETALQFGVPVYTGEVKVDWFRRYAAELRPDAILVCVFGQVIDKPIIQLPKMGIYNFHPSDLAHGRGAGALIYDDLVAQDASTTAWTLHQLSEQVDAGPIVGPSPPVNIRDRDGNIPEDAMAVLDKMLDPLSYMVYFQLEALTEKFLRKEQSPVTHLDYAQLFPAAVKARIMEPIDSRNPVGPLDDPDLSLFDQP